MLPRSPSGFFNPDVIPGIDADFVCSICHNVIHVAAQPSEEDSHIFCHDCLQRAMALNPKCPMGCRGCNRATLSKVPFIDRQINNLTAVCYARAKGCEWTGTFLSLRNTHWPENCLLHEKPCPLCKVLIPKPQIRNHIITLCPKAPSDCPRCSVSLLRDQQEAHGATCPNVPIQCSNGCGAFVLRKDLEHHHTAQCAQAVIPCPLADCTATMHRRDLDSHLNDNLKDHFLLAMAEIQAGRQEREAIRQRLDHLERLVLANADRRDTGTPPALPRPAGCPGIPPPGLRPPESSHQGMAGETQSINGGSGTPYMGGLEMAIRAGLFAEQQYLYETRPSTTRHPPHLRVQQAQQALAMDMPQGTSRMTGQSRAFTPPQGLDPVEADAEADNYTVHEPYPTPAAGHRGSTASRPERPSRPPWSPEAPWGSGDTW